MTLIPASLLTIFSILVAVSAENCDNLGILIYEDLGCTPRYKSNGSCPEAYTCDGLEQWTDKCHYEGKKYKDDEMVPENKTAPLCMSCRCYTGFKTHGFGCVYLDYFGNFPQRGCKNVLPIEGCSPPVQKCSPFATCEVDGKTYEEGDVFFLENKCVRCQCGEGFKLEEPYCTRQKCGEQLISGEDVQKKCAPLYQKVSNGTLCCPWKWICPDGSEKFKKASEGCMFGDQIVEKGQKFTKKIDAEQVICQCLIPPLLTCQEV